jgi:hypothetical protein
MMFEFLVIWEVKMEIPVYRLCEGVFQQTANEKGGGALRRIGSLSANADELLCVAVVALCLFLCACGSGNGSNSSFSVIIINHASVDLYDDIPDSYLTEVRKMWFNMPGESHSRAYYNGLVQLQSSTGGASSKYRIVVSTNPGSGNIDTGDGLAVDYNGVFGSLWGGSYWDNGAGEEDWFYAGTTKPQGHVQHVSNASYRTSILGLGWCWDAYLTASDLDNYNSATQGYSTYAKSLGSKVRVVFTTGPVDGSGSSARDEKYRRVRNYVTNTEILFDYADILEYNDAGQKNPTTYEEIHPDNAGNNDSHIGNTGELRLAKAVWVLMARVSGWDGVAGGTLLPRLSPQD